MARVGRNARCPCGSGSKVKRCCGERKGPSEEQLARAFVAGEARAAARKMLRHDKDELHELFEDVLDLPGLDGSLVVRLPRLTTPEIQRLGDALFDDDADAVDAALPAAVARCDTWTARAGLARAVTRLRDDDRIDGCVAAVALVDLNHKRSALLTSSVIQAVAIDAGAVDTRSGLLVAAR
ncbi:MAG: SEC-C metal-binding domain-containing protein [Acidimicrobiales bacterium]